VNLCCYLAAFDLRLTDDLPVRVNGDDIAFRMSQDQDYENWWSYNRSVGFFPSVGKNYRSAEFVNINSCTFISKPDGSFHHEPFCNLSLLQDTSRKGLDAGQRLGEPWFRAGTAWEHLTEHHHSVAIERMYPWFSFFHSLPGDLPHDLPMCMGGPGVILSSDTRDFTVDTRAFAGYYFMSDPSKQRQFDVQVPTPSQHWLSSLTKELRSNRFSVRRLEKRLKPEQVQDQWFDGESVLRKRDVSGRSSGQFPLLCHYAVSDSEGQQRCCEEEPKSYWASQQGMAKVREHRRRVKEGLRQAWTLVDRGVVHLTDEPTLLSYTGLAWQTFSAPAPTVRPDRINIREPLHFDSDPGVDPTPHLTYVERTIRVTIRDPDGIRSVVSQS